MAIHNFSTIWQSNDTGGVLQRLRTMQQDWIASHMFACPCVNYLICSKTRGNNTCHSRKCFNWWRIQCCASQQFDYFSILSRGKDNRSRSTLSCCQRIISNITSNYICICWTLNELNGTFSLIFGSLIWCWWLQFAHFTPSLDNLLICSNFL